MVLVGISIFAYKIEDMKKYIYAAIAVCAIIAISTILTLSFKLKKLISENDRLQATNTAYNINLKQEKDKVAVYQMTIDELRNSNDSLLQVSQEVVKKKGVLKRDLEYIGYSTGVATKTDTIYLKKDSIVNIIRDSVSIDTTLSDKWYKLDIHLESPNQLVVSPTFKSESHISVYTKKEYKNKRSKIFFIRWFQKKVKVTYLMVEEMNPYIDVQKQKLIKVTK